MKILLELVVQILIHNIYFVRVVIVSIIIVAHYNFNFSTYYNLMNDTLSKGYMGTEESIFSIMVYKHPSKINYFEIDSNDQSPISLFLIYSAFLSFEKQNEAKKFVKNIFEKQQVVIF